MICSRGEYFAPLAEGWDLQLYGSVNYRDESSTTLDNYFYAEDLTLVGARVALYDFPDESALKLTIAQYLTPGDLSIQEIGITPDVLLLPGRVQKDQVAFFAPPRAMGEADLDGHFTNGNGPPPDAPSAATRRTAEKPALELRYVLDEKSPRGPANGHGADLEISAEQAEDEASEANPDEFVEDYQIQFARDLLGRAPFAERAKLLDAAKGSASAVEARGLEPEERLVRLGPVPPMGFATGVVPRGGRRLEVVVLL